MKFGNWKCGSLIYGVLEISLVGVLFLWSLLGMLNELVKVV